jgi:hypothetical protein
VVQVQQEVISGLPVVEVVDMDKVLLVVVPAAPVVVEQEIMDKETVQSVLDILE